MRIPVSEKFYQKMRVLEIKSINKFHFHSKDYKEWYQLFPYWFITNKLITFRRLKYIIIKWIAKEYIEDSIDSHHFKNFGNLT